MQDFRIFCKYPWKCHILGCFTNVIFGTETRLMQTIFKKVHHTDAKQMWEKNCQIMSVNSGTLPLRDVFGAKMEKIIIISSRINGKDVPSRLCTF